MRKPAHCKPPQLHDLTWCLFLVEIKSKETDHKARRNPTVYNQVNASGLRNGLKYIQSHYSLLEEGTQHSCWKNSSLFAQLPQVPEISPIWVASALWDLWKRGQWQWPFGTRLFPFLNCSHMCGGKEPPACTTIDLEHIQNRPHSRWACTASSKHTLIAKSGAPGWRAGGGELPGSCVLA